MFEMIKNGYRNKEFILFDFFTHELVQIQIFKNFNLQVHFVSFCSFRK